MFGPKQQDVGTCAAGVEEGQRVISAGFAKLLALPKPDVVQHCGQLNISVCDPTVQWTSNGNGVSIVVYNSLAHARTASVIVPVALQTGSSWVLTGTAAITISICLQCLLCPRPCSSSFPEDSLCLRTGRLTEVVNR